jgi:Kef-type K+ transport system membrane component KefB
MSNQKLAIMSNQELTIQFFLQLAFILAVIRLVGAFALRIGQPQVVGEMIAGVIIGPSLFGALFPDLQAQLFPKQSLSIIYAVSQVGLVLYMFLVGCEFNVDLVRRRVRNAAAVSLAGILVPFTLGGLLAYSMRDSGVLFTPDVSLWETILFTGSAMSITAFPMLARILYEHGIAGTALGTLALAAGSMDDAAAWCLLAVVLASFSGNATIAIAAIGGGILYALAVLGVLRPLLRRLDPVAKRNGGVNGPMLTLILALLMLAAWVTDAIGIYAVFGAFILGIAMPRGIVTRQLQMLLEPLTTNFLLPLFFIYSGLNTQLGLIVTPGLWAVTGLVLLAACVGKGGGCWAAARWSGETPRDALAVGALMNARGLMELILLNIGLQHGVITPAMFTIMVIMAVVTTLMASPLFALIYGRLSGRLVGQSMSQSQLS